jgi:DNA modification methylase
MPEIKMRKLSELRRHPDNPRHISKARFNALMDSIKENHKYFEGSPLKLSDRTGKLVIIGGNMRYEAAKAMGLKELPTILISGLTVEEERKAILLDNAHFGEWDWDLLANKWDDIDLPQFGIEIPSFDLDADLEEPEPIEEDEKAVEEVINKATELQKKWNTATGQIWKLGNHRVMCGDSTKPEDVARLMDGNKAQLLHADPPYGMGKEKDGVANDNLYRENLDEFQLSWWGVWRKVINDNASVYIWGNAEDLWRLWFVAGLQKTERMTFRNQIVWDKKHGMGMLSPEFRQYPTVTEHCLFFMLGEQGFNNDADNYWEGWEPVRSWLENEKKSSGLTNADCNRVCGKQNVTQSAFTKGGFRLILEKDYLALRNATGAKFFKREYDDLKREYDDLKRAFYATRAYFDNAHDKMTDVWEFPRVVGDDRWSHATPKPLPMMERVMKSSCPLDGIVVEPFGGSGSTLMGCETTGRKCYTMELSPEYVAVIIERWAMHTGKTPELIER